MAGQALREDLIEAGGRLLDAADAAAIRPAAAAWLYDHALGEWRYYMATILVDVLGRRPIYSALIRVLDEVKPPEDFSIIDLFLASPRDPSFRLISSLVRAPGNQRLEFSNCLVNGIAFEAMLYRSDPEALNGDADDLARAFKTRANERERQARRPGRVRA
jgi:hypothetical protein